MAVRAVERAFGGDAVRPAEKARDEIVRALDKGRFDDALPMLRAFATALGMDADRVAAAFIPPDEAPLT